MLSVGVQCPVKLVTDIYLLTNEVNLIVYSFFFDSGEHMIDSPDHRSKID